MPVLRAVDVVKRYGERVVLDGLTLDLEPKEALLVRGRSGSGKSTLLHILAGVEAPDAGRVELDGEDLGGLEEDTRASLRLRQVGLVFQHFNLVPDLTAEENVRLPMVLAGASRPRDRAAELLRRVGLADRARAFPSSLSGGEMQRVAVARALANEPKLILADEPTANLDEENGRRVLTLLLELAAEGRAVLVASHDPLALEHISARRELRGGRLAAP